MRRNIADDPLAQAVLRHTAKTRSDDDALGELARAALSGETSLQTAAASSYYGHELQTVFGDALDTLNRLTPEERAQFSRQAERLRNPDAESHQDGAEA